MNKLLALPALLLSGCAGLIPEPTPPPSGPYTQIERQGTSREAGIIEELSISGCDIKRFETMTSPRKNAIIVTCK